MFTLFTAFFIGGFISEIIQSLLPVCSPPTSPADRAGSVLTVQWKTFQWGDICANLLGSSLFLYLAVLLNRRIRRRQEIALLYQPLGAASSGDPIQRGAYAYEYDEYSEDQPATYGDRGGHSNVWDVEDDEDEVDARARPGAGQRRSTEAGRGAQLFSIGDQDEELERGNQ